MEGIFPSPAEAETEEEMFTMPTIDMVATGRNIMRLREAAVLDVPMDEIIVIDVNRTKQISA